MAEKTLDYFQKREKKNQDFLAGNPEMEIVEKLEGYQKKTKELVKAIREIPEHKRGYDLNMLLVKSCIAAADMAGSRRTWLVFAHYQSSRKG